MAACPLYLPAEQVRPEVRALEAALKLANPPLTVGGIQSANESDASLARRHEAEYRVRGAERMARLVEPTPAAALDDLAEIHAALDAAAGFNRLARELRVACAAARSEGGDVSADASRESDEFECGGGCGRPMGDAGMPRMESRVA